MHLITFLAGRSKVDHTSETWFQIYDYVVIQNYMYDVKHVVILHNISKW